MSDLNHADIRWRVGQISKKDPHKGSLLGYIDARTCMEALDALDPEWSAVHGNPIIVGGELVGVPCTVTVKGISRSDVGMPSSQEPIKGAYSDALKRAAVHFGIGRELYELPRIYVKLDEYKKPVATPTYRNGRWTLPSDKGSVFYDREPTEQPEPRAARASSPATYRRGELAALMADKHLDLKAVEEYAGRVGIAKGQRATNEQMDALIAAVSGTTTPSSDAGQSETATVQPESPPTSAAPASDSVPSGQGSQAAPTFDDVLRVSGGVEVPPKPATPEYQALEATERAAARAYWQKQSVTA